MQMMPSCDQIGVPIHFHSSTIRVGFLDEFAHPAEGFPRQFASPAILFGSELRCRLASARGRLFHVLILEVPDIFICKSLL